MVHWRLLRRLGTDRELRRRGPPAGMLQAASSELSRLPAQNWRTSAERDNVGGGSLVTANCVSIHHRPQPVGLLEQPLTAITFEQVRPPCSSVLSRAVSPVSGSSGSAPMLRAKKRVAYGRFRHGCLPPGAFLCRLFVIHLLVQTG